MRLRLRTAEILAVTGLTVLVVVTTTLFHFFQVTRITVEGASQAALLGARQIYAQSRRALARGAGRPAWEVLRANRELRELIETSVSYAPDVVYVFLADLHETARLHSEQAKEGTTIARRPELGDLLGANPLRRLMSLMREQGIYEVVLPLELDGRPFGSIRLGLSTSLLRRELGASLSQAAALAGVALPVAWIFALLMTHVALQPIRRITREVERLRMGGGGTRLMLGKENEFQELAAQLELLREQMHVDRLKDVGEQGQMQKAVDRLEDGFLFLSADHRLLFMNRVAEAMLDRHGGSVVGLPFEEVLEAGHPLRVALQSALNGRSGLRNALVRLAEGGHEREILVSAVPLKDARDLMGTVILLKDLESIKTFRSLVSYSVKLTALGRLMSGVAHEIKNPLNAMMLHLELLRERLGSESEGPQESLDILQSEIRRLDRAVQGLLRFIRPQELSLVRMDLNELFAGIKALLTPEWEPRGVQFEFHRDASLPLIMADGELLHQVLLNIALNACQAMPNGGRLQVATQREGEDFVTITFTDEGVGIAPEDLEKIFTLYYTTKPEGSGMGLALAYRIVQLHDGSIEVASEPGRGTSFTVRLPVG
jgi:signal transduction histidine kinase